MAPSPRAPVAWHTTTLGLCEDYPEETRTLEHARADLAMAHNVGAKVLRIAFGWDAMEPERGKLDWSFWDEYVRTATDDFGIRLIPYICYTPKWAATDQGENYWRSPPRDPADYARFVAALVQHYRDRIHSWELWNEPDNQAYWLGTPEQFAALVRAGSAAVRGADPRARIVLGGIAGETDFLAKLLRQERIGPAVDVVNFHSYFETWHPNAIERLPSYIETVAGLVHDTGGHQPLWMAETGYSSVGDRPDTSSSYRVHYRGEHSEEAQAVALARTLFMSLTTEQLDVIAWYRINDLVAGQDVIGDDNNRHLGLRRVDGQAKPALATFAYLASLFGQPYAVIRPTVTPIALHDAEPQVHAYRLRDGRRIVAAWHGTPSTPGGREPLPDARASTLRIAIPDTRARRVILHDTLGHAISRPDATWANRGNQVELTWTLRDGEMIVAEISP